MKFAKYLTAAAFVALAGQVAADEAADQKQLVIMAIQLKGFSCASVLTVTERPEPVAYDVVCAENENGSGEQTTYFVQIANGDIIVKPE